MPKRLRSWRGRGGLWVLCLLLILPFVLANACFDTSTAPDVLPPETDSSETDTTTALQVALF